MMIYDDYHFDDDVFRQTATGLGGIATRVAGLLAPPLNLLAVYHYSIPIVVFSSLTLVGGSLAFLLPETQGRERGLWEPAPRDHRLRSRGNN